MTVSRRLKCCRCPESVTVFEIPAPYLDPAGFMCGACWDRAELDRLAEAEALDRRHSLFQVPALPFNQRQVG